MRDTARVCAAYAANLNEQCGRGTQYWASECEKATRRSLGEGCATPWLDYASCRSRTEVRCAMDKDDICAAAHDAYVACQSRFVARTGCMRLEDHDEEMCSHARPFALECSGKIPKGCEVASVSDAATGLACCVEPDQEPSGLPKID